MGDTYDTYVPLVDENFGSTPVVLTAEDKLTIRTLEVEAYRIQATQQQVNEQMKAAVESLNAGIRAVAEKLGYDQKEYRLDLKTMEFVRVGSGDVTA